LLASGGRLTEVLDRYLLTVVHQASQTAACNARHNVEERMCRWLLMTHDRASRDEFYLTQEFLGIMLGVRRQSVSLTASTLQRAGLITYSRGHMKILDREGLERSSCECYRTVSDMYERVMETPTA
jgi:CRP-like cAMP-binding protein